MEKYKNFADGSTGANPFLPPWVNKKRYLFEQHISLFLFFPVFFLRLLLGVFSLLCILISYHISTVFFRFPVIKNKVYRILTKPFFRLLLLCFGVTYSIEPADYRRLRINRREYDVKPLSDGDILFTNYMSFIEILFYAYKFNPVFVQYTVDENLALVGPFEACWNSLLHRFLIRPAFQTTFSSLDQLSLYCFEEKLGPCVVFPENCKSNGRCIFKWKVQPLISEKNQQFNEYIAYNSVIAAIHYSSYFYYSPHHTVYSGIRHLLLLLYNTGCKLELTITSKQQAYEYLSKSLNKDQVEFMEELRHCMEKLVPSIQLVSIDGEKFNDFKEYFEKTQKPNYMYMTLRST